MLKLKLPKSKRIKGLYLYCTKCREHYSDDSLVNCRCDKLVYKAKVHVPNTKNSVRTRHLIAVTFEDALIEMMEFVRYLRNTNFTVSTTVKSSKPILLIDCFAVYMAFLNNEDVAEFKIRQRTKHSLSAYERAMKYFSTSLSERGINVDFLKFQEVNEKLIGFFHTFLIENRKLRNKTYNNTMYNLKSFFTHIIKNYYPEMANPMADFKKREVVPIINSISEEEFERLLQVVNYKNGVIIQDARHKYNIYKPWLIDAYTLGLLTGGRREEITSFKWSGIALDADGEPSYLTVNHYKINRAKGNLVSEKEYKIKRVFISAELKEFLYELGYEKYKGEDRYILAPEETVSRKFMLDVISISFSHYFKLINNGVAKQFKLLRKTWITMMYRIYPSEAHVITGHERQDIIHNHYIDKAKLLNDIQGLIKLRRKVVEDSTT